MAELILNWEFRPFLVGQVVSAEFQILEFSEPQNSVT